MKMKSRVAAIIAEIVEKDAGIPIESILLHYNITERLLYYDIKEINTWLNNNLLGAIEIEDQYLFLISTKKEDIKIELEKRLYYFSNMERRVFELFMIALSYDALYLSTFQTYFKKCKSAIVSDIHKIKEYLENERISLLFQLRQGYLLEGDELAIRKKLDIYLHTLNPHCTNVLKDLKKIFQESLLHSTKMNINYFHLARHLVIQYESDMKYKLYTSVNNDFVCFMIMISWIRSMKGNIVVVNDNNKNFLYNTNSFRFVSEYCRRLKYYGLEIPDNEHYYITALLLALQEKRHLDSII